ncbi:hypothetical protein BX600DRAFT_457372, partial [Xylariales sp. PMI_506]
MHLVRLCETIWTLVGGVFLMPEHLGWHRTTTRVGGRLRGTGSEVEPHIPASRCYRSAEGGGQFSNSAVPHGWVC